jgi:hypothetical protein
MEKARFAEGEPMLKPGHVIDLYDDAEGVHLADGKLLEKYGELHIDTPDELVKLPDKEFALVIFSKTGEKHRKYPLHHAEALAVSTHYFEKTAESLPAKARVIAASNLLMGHLRFGAEPTEDLSKIASEDVVGPYFNEAEDKEGNWGFKRPEIATRVTKFAIQRELPDGSIMDAFPITDLDEVKASADALKKCAYDIPAHDRYEASLKLQACLKELGADADDGLSKIASFDPNPAFMAHIAARQEALTDDGEKKVLDELVKIAEKLQPPYLARALEDFDRRTGLAHFWDQRIRNPWDSCYQQKTAGLKEDDKTITKEALVALIDSGKLKAMFKESTLKDFRKMPVEVYQSLPTPTKSTIAGMIV